ncbi:MarR family winged helix-turn-helix transcriptional regulator [Symmachiella dynata]|uniref:MarR family winged helix-turn-helix transcriptional regulator n=1 Tax=Symmachiella dynata TaxID=2527995 RepID=UPI00118AB610|nr:MarR family transcriptional regulator [Symmachiella dynata]QDT51624.1 HTH-type transcriptional regulator MhqR [Symmachiella dynata]
MTAKRTTTLQPDDFFCEQVLIALRRIIRAVDLRSRKLLQKHGLTGPQLTVLKALCEIGEVPAGELAKRVHLSQGTVTGILDRLTRRDFVVRRRCPVDKRRMLVVATPQATELVRSAPSLLQEQFVHEFAKLADWEKTQTLSSLQRIVSMMEAEEIDATPMLAIGAIDESAEKAADRLSEQPPA